jgi:cell shape-determining protein MreC
MSGTTGPSALEGVDVDALLAQMQAQMSDMEARFSAEKEEQAEEYRLREELLKREHLQREVAIVQAQLNVPRKGFWTAARSVLRSNGVGNL